MRINGVTYGKLKTPFKVNGTLKSQHLHFNYFSLPISRTNVLKYSFIPHAITAWNSLSQSIIDLRDSANAFKPEIKKFKF